MRRISRIAVLAALLLHSGTGISWSQALVEKKPAPPPQPGWNSIQAPLPPAAKPPTKRPLQPVPTRPITRPSRPAVRPWKPPVKPNYPYTRPTQSVVRPYKVPMARPSAPTTPPNALVWDKEFKQMTAKPGDTNTLIKYHFTNAHTSEVVIQSVRASCGCTTVKLPAMPWRIPPGSNGVITANLDLRGRRGVQTKSLMVNSSSGYKSLLFKVTIPPKIVDTTVTGQKIDEERIKNMRVAMMDRQAVFKNQDCAKCHLQPTQGKMGKELYEHACGICHDSDRRATMVPSLAELRVPTSAPYWKYWIVNGRPGSLMPAFAQALGGPLTTEQIDSLVAFLTETITRKPRPVPVRRTALSPPASAGSLRPKAAAPAPTPTGSK